MKERIDARGLLCPEPVLRTKNAVDSNCTSIEVWVDNEVASNNVGRFLTGKGYHVVRKDTEKGTILDAQITAGMGLEPLERRETEQQKGADLPPTGILITSQRIGSESHELGEVLMKSFLGTLSQIEPLPTAIALMNGAVFLATEASSASDTLLDLEKKGVRVLVCGLCVKHFQLEQKMVVGDISNMYEITETIFSTPKPVILG